MKKICFFISNIDHAGGTERVTSMIANELSLEGYDITILSLSGGKNPFFVLNKEIKYQSLFSKKVSMKRNGIAAILKLRKFIENNEIENLIVVDSILCMISVPALSLMNVKHICWEHFNFTVDLGVKFRGYGRLLAARFCDVVITLTEKDKIIWKNNIKSSNLKAKLISISNPSPYGVLDTVPKLEKKIVLAVGRLTYQKGFDLLLEAWHLVFNEDKEWKLYIVGDGEDKCQLEIKAKELGLGNSVNFVGKTKNISKYYQEASLYCMTSRFEGLPMVLLEATSYGLPIVAFDCNTGPSEIVEEKLLIKDFNINELSEKIKYFFKLSPKIYKEHVLFSKKQNEKFLINNIIKKWIEIL